MPNAIKYSTSAQTLALKKGNYWIGTGDVGKGPTSTTDYYNGITPPSGGYTIYLNKASGGPSIYTASNDSALISLSNTIAGQTFATAAAALAWFATQTDKMVFNADYPAVVTNGLVLNVDAGFTPSYPTTGTTWYDVSSGGNNGTLINGPTFNSSDGGSIVFDKVDDKVQRNSINVGNNFTIGIWCKPTSASRQTMMANSYIYDPNFENEGFLFNIGNAGTDMFISLGRDLYGKISPTGLVSANTWFYACASYNGSTINLYFNGANVGGNFFGSPITITYNTNPFFLGSWNYGGVNPYEWFGGNIAVAQVYNRALSSTEVLQNFNATKTRFGL
jgi:hypothetical protein